MKVHQLYQRHWWQRHQRQIFVTGTAGVVDTVGKFATGVTDTGGNLPPVSTTPAAIMIEDLLSFQLPPVSTTLVVHLELKYLREF